jgi:apurinic endonuclease APN1
MNFEKINKEKHDEKSCSIRPPLGFHVSCSSPCDILLTMAERGYRAGSLFLQTPRRWAPRKLKDSDGKTFRATIDGAPGLADTIIPHGSYLINLASPRKDVREKSIALLAHELIMAGRLGLRWVVIHPGSNVKGSGQSREEGLRKVSEGLECAFAIAAKNTKETIDCSTGLYAGVLLENNAGVGACVGTTFAELKQIRDGVDRRWRDRVAYCIDTCHMFAMGYGIAGGEWKKAFVEECGEEEKALIKCFHFNDSKTPLGDKKDRHADHGGASGYIGVDALRELYRDKDWLAVPFVMEVRCDERDAREQYALYAINEM